MTSVNYGSFSSFAPQYDSAFANLNKEDSKLVYSSYGDDIGVQYAERLASIYFRLINISNFAATISVNVFQPGQFCTRFRLRDDVC